MISATKRTSKKCQVAIKRCYIEDHDVHHHTYILRELRIMGCLSHPNLIQLTEACMWGDYLWMAMELMTCSVFGLLYNVSVGLPESYAVRVALEVRHKKTLAIGILNKINSSFFVMATVSRRISVPSFKKLHASRRKV